MTNDDEAPTCCICGAEICDDDDADASAGICGNADCQRQHLDEAESDRRIDERLEK